MRKLLLSLAIAVIPMLASAQFVRHTQGCGEVKADDDLICSFGVTTDTNILDGGRSGLMTLTIRPAKMLTGASFSNLPKDELPALIQTLKYAKENPPSAGDGESTHVVFRAKDLLEFRCDIRQGKNPEYYVKISPNTPGIGARISWTSIDELISILEKCNEILCSHCAGD